MSVNTNTNFNSIDGEIMHNPSGDLKIQPHTSGDVILFSDIDVDGVDSGKELKVWRKALEGDDYIKFYVSANGIGTIDSSKNLTMQAGSGGNITLQVGDDASVNVDSNGNITVNGTVDGRNVADDGIKLDGISSNAEVATKEFFLSSGSAILGNNAIFKDKAIALPTGVTFSECSFTFHLPSDFKNMSYGYPKIILYPGLPFVGNARISSSAINFSANRKVDALIANIDFIDEYEKTVSSTNHVIIKEDISAALTGLNLSAGDIVQVTMQRNSNDSLDTLAGDLNVCGVIVKYN